MTMRTPQEATTGTALHAHLSYRLPETDVAHIEGVLDLLAAPPFNGRADLPELTEEAKLPDEELFPTYEALGLLGLAQVEKGDITLTALGHSYAQAAHMRRKEIFGQQLLTHVPLAAHIRNSLEQEAAGSLSEKGFLDTLEEFLKEEEAKRVLEVVVEWGRYGEVYEYDYHTGQLKLPENETE
jgi:NitT/TauT family transport system ATP-binding protein